MESQKFNHSFEYDRKICQWTMKSESIHVPIIEAMKKKWYKCQREVQTFFVWNRWKRKGKRTSLRLVRILKVKTFGESFVGRTMRSSCGVLEDAFRDRSRSFPSTNWRAIEIHHEIRFPFRSPVVSPTHGIQRKGEVESRGREPVESCVLEAPACNKSDEHHSKAKATHESNDVGRRSHGSNRTKARARALYILRATLLRDHILLFSHSLLYFLISIDIFLLHKLTSNFSIFFSLPRFAEFARDGFVLE